MRWLKILVAYDGSQCSERARATAVNLAKAEGAPLLVCGVVDPIAIADANAPAPPTQAVLDKGREEMQRLIDDAVARCRADGAQASGVRLEGEPAYELVEEAKRSGADAIVMGTHGRSGVKRLLLGSVAEEMLRSAHIPVVVVHDASPK